MTPLAPPLSPSANRGGAWARVAAAMATARRVSGLQLTGLCLGTWLGALGGGQLGWAREAILQDRTVPEAAEQPPGLLEWAFEERLEKETFFPRLKEFLGTQPAFLRDTELLVSLMERDFNRAGEDAWLVGLAYDLGRLGLTGLSAFFNFAQGTGVRDPTTGQPRSNDREFDLTVDYRVTKKGWLEGLWFRLRGAVLEEGGDTQQEIRLILNYAFPVL